VKRAALAGAVSVAALLAALASGCGRSDVPSREPPSYVSPGGEVRFWAPASWRRRWRRSKSWHIRYRGGAEAAAEQRHAVVWLSADYVPERSDQEGAVLFRLFVFTTAGYESLAAEPGMPAGTPIGAGGGRVAVASIPTLNPYEGAGYVSQEYVRMRPERDTLRAAIRLSGAEAGTAAAWGADTVTYSIRLPAADALGREVRARFAPDGIADSALVPVAWPHEAWGAIGAPLLVYRRG
jgi:hypothetical protein